MEHCITGSDEESSYDVSIKHASGAKQHVHVKAGRVRATIHVRHQVCAWVLAPRQELYTWSLLSTIIHGRATKIFVAGCVVDTKRPCLAHWASL